MRLLLDTHVLIWFVEKNPKFTKEIIDLITDDDNIVFVSIATLWEMQIKSSLKKIELPQNINMILEQNSYDLLNILPSHIEKLADLPMHHRDPFDRMLVAQSLVENLTLVTTDQYIVKYDCNIIQL